MSFSTINLKQVQMMSIILEESSSKSQIWYPPVGFLGRQVERSPASFLILDVHLQVGQAEQEVQCANL